MHGFSVMDYLIIILVLLSLIWGFFRGFLREAISTFSVIIAVACASIFADTVSPIFSWWESTQVRYYAAFACIFLFVLVLGIIISRITGVLAKTLGLGFFDRIMGGTFGALRGVLIVIVALFLVNKTDITKASWYKASVVAPQFNTTISWMNNHFPSDITHAKKWLDQQKDSKQITGLKHKVSLIVNKHVKSVK